MEMNIRTRWYLRIQNIFFIALVVALLGAIGWLGERYSVAFDWTANQRNSLTADSVALLETLQAPLHVTAYVSDDDVLREAIGLLVKRYQRVKPDVSLQFVNPDLSPEQARSAGVRFDGTLLIEYRGRSEQVSGISESAISETIARLARERETWVVFMTGHGERAAHGSANFDLSLLAAQLEQQGFRLQSLNIATTALPGNTGILVVAGPRTALLPAETARLREYLDGGGNLLWLADPDGVAPLPDLENMLGVEVKPGTVVDATTQMLGVDDPTVAVVADYPEGGPVGGFGLMTLYPRAAALAVNAASGWESSAILRTTANSWRETGALIGNVRLDEADEAGPLVIGYALERARKDGGVQRVVVVGDGDFASNAFVGNQGNLGLATNLFNWLGQYDALLNIRIKAAPDAVLQLGSTAQVAIAFGFLLVLPLAFLGTGVLVFIRRRRR